MATRFSVPMPSPWIASILYSATRCRREEGLHSQLTGQMTRGSRHPGKDMFEQVVNPELYQPAANSPLQANGRGWRECAHLAAAGQRRRHRAAGSPAAACTPQREPTESACVGGTAGVVWREVLRKVGATVAADKATHDALNVCVAKPSGCTPAPASRSPLPASKAEAWPHLGVGHHLHAHAAPQQPHRPHDAAGAHVAQRAGRRAGHAAPLDERIHHLNRRGGVVCIAVGVGMRVWIGGFGGLGRLSLRWFATSTAPQGQNFKPHTQGSPTPCCAALLPPTASLSQQHCLKIAQNPPA